MCLLYNRHFSDYNADKRYDNEEAVRQMVKAQKNMRIPASLVPRCPVCGGPMTMNLRADNTFVQDDGWYRAAGWYDDFVRRHQNMPVLYLELGVGMNTPGIIKFNFWQQILGNAQAHYACINCGQASCPKEIEHQSMCINADIGEVLEQL